MILRDQVLEVRNVEGRLHIARKPRQYDEYLHTGDEVWGW